MSNNYNDDSPTSRLLRNDPDLLHMYLSSDIPAASDERELETLIAAFSSSLHLRHVYFRNFKLGGFRVMERLLEATTTIRNLESLFFHCTEVPVRHLTDILLQKMRHDHYPSLQALGLRYCKLRYENQAEYEAFDRALRENTSLEDVCIECCEWQVEERSEENNTTTIRSDKTSAFLEALSHISTLQHLECVLPKTTTSRRRLPARTLQRIGQIPQLSTLRLRNIWFPQEDVALLCHSFHGNQNNNFIPLQKLLLSCDLGHTSAKALANFLQDPSTSLIQLSLRVDALQDDPDCPVFIAQALQQQQQQKPDCALQHFHFSGQAASQISQRAKLAFCDMMQTNISVEFVRLEVADYHLQKQIAFYLQLNHTGRRDLFRGLQYCHNNNNNKAEADELWLRALCQNATNLRAIHHFLALNPGLFALAAIRAEEQREKMEERYQREHPNHHLHQHPSLQDVDSFDQGIDYDSDGW